MNQQVKNLRMRQRKFRKGTSQLQDRLSTLKSNLPKQEAALAEYRRRAEAS